MGVTFAQARVFGENETREYSFLVDTGSTCLALPLEEIEALGLRPGRARVRLESANGMVEAPTFIADGELLGEEFTAIMVPAAAPLLGYQLLQNLRYRVNTVTEQIERVPDDERGHPPYQL